MQLHAWSNATHNMQFVGDAFQPSRVLGNAHTFMSSSSVTQQAEQQQQQQQQHAAAAVCSSDAGGIGCADGSAAPVHPDVQAAVCLLGGEASSHGAALLAIYWQLVQDRCAHGRASAAGVVGVGAALLPDVPCSSRLLLKPGAVCMWRDHNTHSPDAGRRLCSR